jgi:trehalose 6-phosphate phosphatase
VLERFAARDTLVAFDYDGTLAPIVADPSAAHMRDSTRKLLTAVARIYPTVVITGRSRRDALRFLADVHCLEIIGNHGLETEGAGASRFVSRVAAWKERLETKLGSLPGVRVEDKRYSLTVHYRASPDKAEVRARIGTAANALDGVRLIGGKDVVNLVPLGAASKGDALEAAMGRHGCRRAIFAGDDETDEDVFALCRPERVLTIRVEPRGDTSADYCLIGQPEMDAFLECLVRAAGMGLARGAPH